MNRAEAALRYDSQVPAHMLDDETPTIESRIAQLHEKVRLNLETVEIALAAGKLATAKLHNEYAIAALAMIDELEKQL